MKRMTMAMVALAAMPAILSAQQPQQDTTRIPVDSGRTNMQQQSDTADTSMQGQVGQQNEQGQTMGQRSGRNARGSLGLSRSEVVQLQQALSNTGCDAGTADGVVGPKTRQAMQCARQQLGVSGNDNQALFQALNLNFANQQGQADTSGAASTQPQNVQSQSSDPAAQAVQGDSSQVGGRNMGRVRPPEDTTARVRGDTSATNRARQQGMTDSTMMRPDSTHSMHPPMDSTMARPTSPTMRDTTRDTTRRVPPQQ